MDRRMALDDCGKREQGGNWPLITSSEHLLVKNLLLIPDKEFSFRLNLYGDIQQSTTLE